MLTIVGALPGNRDFRNQKIMSLILEKEERYQQVLLVRKAIVSEARPLFFAGYPGLKSKILEYYGYDTFL